MAKEITQQDLAEQAEGILDGLSHGETFILVRDGKPVGRIEPVRYEGGTPVEIVKAAFEGAPRIDFKKFREDIDRYVDQDPTPRF